MMPESLSENVVKADTTYLRNSVSFGSNLVNT